MNPSHLFSKDALAEKVALVKGGEHDIGRAICLGLAEAGARVVLSHTTTLGPRRIRVNGQGTHVSLPLGVGDRIRLSLYPAKWSKPAKLGN